MLVAKNSRFQPYVPDNELAERFPQLKSFTEDVCSDGFGLENYDMFSRWDRGLLFQPFTIYFDSPWALTMDDEVFFEETLKELGTVCFLEVK